LIEKKIKDENAPKKPAPAFLRWSSVQREELKDELGQLSVTEKAKELGRRWGVLSEEQKQIYQDKYDQEKIDYDIKMKEYRHSEDFLRLQKDKSMRLIEKKIKDENAPKKPAPAFLRWSSVQREELKDELGQLSVTEKAKELGRRWGVLSEEQKQIYQDKYDQEKIDYDIKMKEYRHSEDFLRLQKDKSMRLIEKKIKDENAPKKPAPAFLKWSTVQREELKDELGQLSVTDKAKELGRRWGVLSAEQKQIYQDKYDQEKIDYDIKMKEYRHSEDFLRLQENQLRFTEENKMQLKSRNAEIEAEQKVIDKNEPYFKFTFDTWHKAAGNLAKNHPDISKIGPLEVEQCLHEMWEDKMKKGSIKNKAKHKASKDSNVPKKPLEAFQIFCEIVIPTLREENPNMAITDIRNHVTDNWQGLTELEKATFFQQEESDKVRYREEMEKFQKSIDNL
jgi:hypothetical protein